VRAPVFSESATDLISVARATLITSSSSNPPNSLGWSRRKRAQKPNPYSPESSSKSFSRTNRPSKAASRMLSSSSWACSTGLWSTQYLNFLVPPMEHS
jgi:hypothetical protein